MKRPATIPAILLFLVPLAGLAADLTQPIRIDTGLIQGVPNPEKDVVSFKGIPYAAPPVGNLRWREPLPPLKWEGLRKADKFGASCPQIRFGATSPAPNTSEDCLFLNIWAPVEPAGEKLPILFFVHGGNYQFGSGNMNGEGMAKKGIIFISVNCRLGKFNSMGHPDLTRESPLRSSANYGTLDLIAALKWIQRNITAFGGDPAMVTICGHSTGANNVHYLTACPLAKGLFRGLIAVSFPYDFLMKPHAIGNLWQAEQAGLALAGSRNLKTLDDLRGIPAAELLEGGGGPTYASPVYPLNYPNALEKGLTSDVPTLTGMTSDDFGPPAEHDPHTSLELLKTRLTREFPADKHTAVLKEYPARSDVEAREMWKRAGNEFRMADIFHWATTRSRTAKTPVYTYMFTHPQPMEPKRGAYHGSDLFYQFNDVADPAKPWRDVDRKIAQLASSYWVNFVKTGNPNGPGLPEWHAFDPNVPSTMYLNENPAFRPITRSGKAWQLLGHGKRASHE